MRCEKRSKTECAWLVGERSDEWPGLGFGCIGSKEAIKASAISIEEWTETRVIPPEIRSAVV